MGQDTQLEEAMITTNGDDPAIELPNGERLTLNVHVNLLSDEPFEGGVDYEAEVVIDEYSWWHLATDSDVEITTTPEIGHHDHDADD